MKAGDDAEVAYQLPQINHESQTNLLVIVD